MWQGDRTCDFDFGEASDRPGGGGSIEWNLGELESRGTLRRACPTGRK